MLKIKLKSHALRQLLGSLSFHLLRREQNGVKEGTTVLVRKWKGHLIACIVWKDLSQDSAVPSRHKPNFCLLGSNTLPGLLQLLLAKNIPKTGKEQLRSMRQRNDHRVSANHQPSNTPSNSGNQKGPVELEYHISESRDPPLRKKNCTDNNKGNLSPSCVIWNSLMMPLAEINWARARVVICTDTGS